MIFKNDRDKWMMTSKRIGGKATVGWFNLSGRQRWIPLGDNTKEVYALFFCDFFSLGSLHLPTAQKEFLQEDFQQG